MKQFIKSILSGSLILIVLGIGLVLSLLIIVNPIQADRSGLNSSIDVAATAQVLQTGHQQIKLETTRQAQTAAWNDRLTEAQQRLTQFDDESGHQLSQLQAQLADLNAHIEQTRLDIETAQQDVKRLRQTIEIDEANYQDELVALETQLSQRETQLRLDLQTTLDQLQAAPVTLDSNNPGQEHPIPKENGEDQQGATTHNEGDDHSNQNEHEGEKNND